MLTRESGNWMFRSPNMVAGGMSAFSLWLLLLIGALRPPEGTMRLPRSLAGLVELAMDCGTPLFRLLPPMLLMRLKKREVRVVSLSLLVVLLSALEGG